MIKYSRMIKRCRSLAIIVYDEYAYTSSMWTDYCYKYVVKHIDAMSGEKIDCIFVIDDITMLEKFVGNRNLCPVL